MTATLEPVETADKSRTTSFPLLDSVYQEPTGPKPPRRSKGFDGEVAESNSNAHRWRGTDYATSPDSLDVPL